MNNEMIEKLLSEIRGVLESDEISVIKKGKSGEKTLNLKEKIKSFDIKAEDNTVKILMRLPAGNTENINPSLFTDYSANSVSVPFFVRIVRKNAFDAQGNPFQ